MKNQVNPRQHILFFLIKNSKNQNQSTVLNEIFKNKTPTKKQASPSTLYPEITQTPIKFFDRHLFTTPPHHATFPLKPKTTKKY
ncbi:hypothetical protein [Zoogloea dura]|uniref:Uncharacterized protein n=1 Tax=Zoogloea dura TaxID=2728840 RepID=A0A848GB50_9RHOO|nr:hypothetical protein [Zoogloea dura]NML28769.1 hypothetical protein [Zoogloea dura]